MPGKKPKQSIFAERLKAQATLEEAAARLGETLGLSEKESARIALCAVFRGPEAVEQECYFLDMETTERVVKAFCFCEPYRGVPWHKAMTLYARRLRRRYPVCRPDPES